jgi:hypothetical protein
MESMMDWRTEEESAIWSDLLLEKEMGFMLGINDGAQVGIELGAKEAGMREKRLDLSTGYETEQC